MKSSSGDQSTFALPRKAGGRDRFPYTYYKRPFFTTSSESVGLFLRWLAEDMLTWSEMRDCIHYDPDAIAVCDGFIGHGYGDHLAYPFLVSATEDPSDQLLALTPRGLAALLQGRLPTGTPPPLHDRTVRITIRDLAAAIGGS